MEHQCEDPRYCETCRRAYAEAQARWHVEYAAKRKCTDARKASRPQCKDIPDEVILEACDAFHRELRQRGPAGNAQTPEVRLAGVWPPKLILAKMENLDRRGLIEYGVSLRTAWRKVQK